MTVLEYILGSLLLLVAIVLIVLVMAQKSRENGLSGAIAGGGASDTFFGKHKGRTVEAKMATATKWLGVIFFVLAFAATLLMLFF